MVYEHIDKDWCPRVNVFITNWKDPPGLMGQPTISTGPCSMAMLNYQMVFFVQTPTNQTYETTMAYGAMSKITERYPPNHPTFDQKSVSRNLKNLEKPETSGEKTAKKSRNQSWNLAQTQKPHRKTLGIHQVSPDSAPGDPRDTVLQRLLEDTSQEPAGWGEPELDIVGNLEVFWGKHPKTLPDITVSASFSDKFAIILGL